jgi:membrane-associated phospholipid phosphatase
MEKLNLDKKSLRKFGITMGIALLVIAALIMARHKQNALVAVTISMLFFVFTFSLPILLKPIYIFWMRLAFILGWINTRLILIIMFYLVFTPIGLVIKLFGLDLLDRKIEKEKHSYWINKGKKIFDPSGYERQF